MNEKEINANPLYVVLAGSHAYGTQTPESDLDLRGIVIAPDYIRSSLFKNFEQYEGKDFYSVKGLKPEIISKRVKQRTSKDLIPNEVDSTIYELKKAIKLISDNNPNMMELLYCDEEDILYADQEFEKLRDQRDVFLSLKMKFTYTGYARAQLERINRHRGYLMDGCPKKPERKEYGLPENDSILKESDRILIDKSINSLIKKWYIQDLNIDSPTKVSLLNSMRDFFATTLSCPLKTLPIELKDLAIRKLGLNDEVRFLLVQEEKYNSALENYNSYLKWEKERNPKRKELESKYGFDTKHAMSLIRISRIGVEALETGMIKVKRPDAEELLQIKNGYKSYEEIVEESKKLEKKMEELYATNPCNLPKRVQLDKIENLYNSIIRK